MDRFTAQQYVEVLSLGSRRKSVLGAEVVCIVQGYMQLMCSWLTVSAFRFTAFAGIMVLEGLAGFSGLCGCMRAWDKVSCWFTVLLPRVRARKLLHVRFLLFESGFCLMPS